MERVTRYAAALMGASFAMAAGLFAGAAPAAASTNLTVGIIGRQSDDWPLYIAQKTGILAANGLTVDIVNSGSPVGSTQQLVGGSIDIGAVTSTEIVQAVQSNVPIVSVLQNVNRPPYLILGKKGVRSIAELRGKTVIVSSPNAITRVFMDTVLEKNGIKHDDVTFTYAGATNARYAALLSGAVDASILLPPFSFRAIAQGYPVLADVLTYYPHFLFDTYAVNSSWAPSHRAVLVAFLKSVLAGVRYLYDPKNKAHSIQILSDETNTSPDDATKTYDELVNKIHSYSIGGTSVPDDYNQVVDVLAELGLTKPPMPPPTRYYDNSYVNEALAQLKAKR